MASSDRKCPGCTEIAHFCFFCFFLQIAARGVAVKLHISFFSSKWLRRAALAKKFGKCTRLQ